MKIVEEFKAFALRGSVIDLAVGVIIGAAFGKIVSSLTSDIIMPPIGWLIGGVDFTSLKIALPHQLIGDNPQVVYINYGNFIQTAFDFMIVATSIFVAVKFVNKIRHKDDAQKTAAPVAPSEPSKEELLLTEIRDLLKQDKK